MLWRPVIDRALYATLGLPVDCEEEHDVVLAFVSLEEAKDMNTSDSWRSAFRIELRAAAIGLAARGWPVLPGTYPACGRWAGLREGDGEAPQSGPVPVTDQCPGTTDAEQVASWWNGAPYSLLLATGDAVEAMELPHELGMRVAVELREAASPVPIVATPQQRWFFLTEPGQGLRRDLHGFDDVHRHAASSYVPLPPSPYLQGAAHWRVKPEVCGWRLPSSDLVQDALCEALHLEDVANRLVVARK